MCAVRFRQGGQVLDLRLESVSTTLLAPPPPLSATLRCYPISTPARMAGGHVNCPRRLVLSGNRIGGAIACARAIRDIISHSGCRVEVGRHDDTKHTGTSIMVTPLFHHIGRLRLRLLNETNAVCARATHETIVYWSIQQKYVLPRGNDVFLSGRRFTFLW